MCMEQMLNEFKTNQITYICFFVAIILILFASFIPHIGATKYLNIISILILVCVIYLNIQQTQTLHKVKGEVEEQHEHFRTQINKNIVYSYLFTFSLGLLMLFVIRNMMSISLAPLSV